MIATEQHASDALPLAMAAARLGIRPDALRMRINRGKIKGFKRGGRLFAVLEAAPDQAQRIANTKTEQPSFDQSEQGDDVRDRGAALKPGAPSMPLVIEFQKVELSRLLRDNTRLNHRLDQMMEELRHLREMQQREQVLRQQDQTLRQRAQTLIERLTATPPAGPAPATVSTPPAPDTNRSTTRATFTAREGRGVGGPRQGGSVRGTARRSQVQARYRPAKPAFAHGELAARLVPHGTPTVPQVELAGASRRERLPFSHASPRPRYATR